MSTAIKLLLASWLSLFLMGPLWADVIWQAHCRDRLPYLYFDNGECKGPGADVITEAINQLGHQVQWMFVPWARTIGVAPQGRVDLIPLHSMDEEREVYLHALLIGYGKREVFYFARKNSDIEAKDFNEIISKAYVVGALNGSFYSTEFNQNIDQLRTVFVASIDQIINMLKADRFDLAITSEQHGLSLFESDPELRKINYEDVSINGRFFSVPRRSANYQYVGQLEAILEGMRRSGEVTQIFESHGLEAPIQQAE